MYRLALYGKGGIGKSTTAGNLAALLASEGFSVMLIGCDPKADSTRALMRGVRVPTVLDCMREQGKPSLEQVTYKAPSGVVCIEAGGPIPGVGCAGRGIIAAFDLLEELDAYAAFDPDFVIYDVLGDVVCGGFAMPLRGKYADVAMVVTSGEMMSLYAASNIMRAIDSFKDRKYASFGGLIVNLRDIENEKEKIQQFCEEEKAEVVVTVPRSKDIQLAEDKNMTLIEALPDSPVVESYRKLAAKIIQDAKHG